jgi:YegS/Rv2252/BmrU family lipid kinase
LTDPSTTTPTTRSRRAFVILNPAAGQVAVDAVRQALARVFSSQGDGTAGATDEAVYKLHETSPEEDLAGLVRSAVEQGGYDLIVAAGGDGTVSAVANGLVGTETPLGILPLGTANVLARELGIPIDIEGACRLLVEPHTVRAIDAMKVKDRCYLTQVGVGIDALMIRDTKREAKQRFGRIAYLWTAFTRLLGFQPRLFLLECDGRPIRARASQVVVANCGILGQPPFRWGPDIRIDDGRIDVCIVRARTLWDYVTLARLVVLGQHKQSPNVRYLTAKDRVAIATQRPLPVQADGEIIGETPVEVTVVPRALRVVVPPATGADVLPISS